MKPHLKELITDLKAAARIGHPGALQAGLDRVRQLSDANLPPTALVPLGQALAALPARQLKPLLKDADPALRAIAAVALAERYLTQSDVTPEMLLTPAKDANPEVRGALATTLRSLGESSKHSLKLGALAVPWLHAAEPAVATTGLKIFPVTAPTAAAIRDLLGPLHIAPEQEVRAALVECMNTLASRGHASTVLELLEGWSHLPDPNMWVITHCLSGNWTQNHTSEAIAILNTLIEQTGLLRPIVRTLARLQNGTAFSGDAADDDSDLDD